MCIVDLSDAQLEEQEALELQKQIYTKSGQRCLIILDISL